ncbi:hypothetical protein FWC31_03315 [Candidatus Saccharibacteria bacterium]|nr:hypothetical protein [Candidatus Saccharibacteria bacterium]
MKYRKLVLLAGLSVIGAVFISSVASAKINKDIVQDNNIGIAVSPMLNARLTMDPGSVTEGRFRVRSPGIETTEVFAEVSPYAAGEDERYETGIFNQTSAYTKITEWTTLGLQDCTINKEEKGRIYFTMRPQEECYVTYKITVPADAYGGSQHAAIFVQTVPPESGKGNSTIVNTYRIGYIIRNDVDAPGAKSEGQVVEIKIPKLLFVPPIKTSILVKNTGSLDFEAKYKMTIQTFFGQKEVYSEAKKSLVMAETERLLTDKWDKTPNLGLFKVTVEVTILDETIMLTKTVLVIPLALIVAIIVIILSLTLWIYVKIRKNKSGKSKKV